MKQAVLRMNAAGVWPQAVSEFLTSEAALNWLKTLKEETGKSEDETILLLLCAMRFLKQDVTDGIEEGDSLIRFLEMHGKSLKEISQSRKVQANIPERALPVTEVLARRWGHQPLEVLELGCSFGLIGRALTSPARVMEKFSGYFSSGQQQPEALARVISYRGWDLDPPDRQWLLACMPLPEVRTRIARFIDEIPQAGHCQVFTGSALDLLSFPPPPAGTIPVVLTSFMMYQLPPELKTRLRELINRFTELHRGTWINLDVIPEPRGTTRFILEEDGILRAELENDLCRSWKLCEGI